MQNTPTQTIFGEVTDFLANNPTPQDIIAYQLPSYWQERAHELLEKMARAYSRHKNKKR